MNRALIIFILILSGWSAQAQFVTQGVIEFERRTNLHKSIEAAFGDNDRPGGWGERMMARLPKITNAFFNLTFTQNHSLYEPGRKTEEEVKMMWGKAPAADNEVYTDFKNNTVIASKQVYESRYLLEDSIRNLKWTIKDEVRRIRNYTCRKAVARMFDSVVVVAFYTNDIMVSGGPESFAGLPGMILEIAIPRLYTTWIATNIEVKTVKDEEMIPPKNGKKQSPVELQTSLQKVMKNWGHAAERNVWWVML